MQTVCLVSSGFFLTRAVILLCCGVLSGFSSREVTKQHSVSHRLSIRDLPMPPVDCDDDDEDEDETEEADEETADEDGESNVDEMLARGSRPFLGTRTTDVKLNERSEWRR